MKYQPCGSGEYQLMMEELVRECTPSDLGYAINKESGRREPAIVLRQPMINKDSMKYRDIESSWGVAQASGRIEAMFLKITFKAEPGKEATTIKICINKINPEVIDWFRLLISTEGEMALNDSVGEDNVIMVTGIPLDIPKAILQRGVVYEYIFKMQNLWV